MEDARAGAKVASYRLDASWTTATLKPDALRVSANSGYYDSAGAYHLEGAVTNTGLRTATNVVVAAAFADSLGRVVGADALYTNPAKIGPGHAAPFHFIYSRATAGLIASASLNAQSDELASIMEKGPGTAEQAPASQAGRISLTLDMPSYRPGDTIRIEGRATPAAGESLVLIEFLYPDGSVFSNLQAPLRNAGVFLASYIISPGAGYDNKAFTVRATYAGSNSTASFVYLGPTSAPAQPAPAEKTYSARLAMSATVSEKTKVVTMSLKNPRPTDAQVYSLVVQIEAKSATGPSGWKAEIDENSVTFTTDSKPILAGKTGKFRVTPDGAPGRLLSGTRSTGKASP